MRTAILRKRDIGTQEADRGTITAYMPGNYAVRVINADTVEIAGQDNAGWTLDGYVLPRLASGLYFAQEVV